MNLFSDLAPVRYEGPATTNDFAYRVYDADRRVLDRTMRDWLRPAVCYWHSFNWPGAKSGSRSLLKLSMSITIAEILF